MPSSLSYRSANRNDCLSVSNETRSRLVSRLGLISCLVVWVFFLNSRSRLVWRCLGEMISRRDGSHFGHNFLQNPLFFFGKPRKKDHLTIVGGSILTGWKSFRPKSLLVLGKNLKKYFLVLLSIARKLNPTTDKALKTVFSSKKLIFKGIL